MTQRWTSILAMALLATQGSFPAVAQTRDAIPAAALETQFLEPTAAPPPSPEAPVPSRSDKHAFQMVSRSVRPGTRVWVLSASGPFESRGSEITAEGIRRGALSDEAGEPGPGLVPWSEIQRVQTRESTAGRSAVIGGTSFAVLGVAYVLVASAAMGNDPPSTGTVATVTGVFWMAGTTLGALFGAGGTKWKTVYDPDRR